MAYRDEIEALSARAAALEGVVADRTKELEDARRLLDEAKARASLPVLDDIRVAAPCSADWAKMTGDERVRACGDCQKNVYNLSEMTRDEAQALLIEKEGKLCVRYFRRHDGTILTKDCAVGVSRRRRHRFIAAGAGLALAGAALASAETLFACKCGPKNVQVEVMGAIAVEPPPPPPPPPAPIEVKGEPMFVEMGDVAASPPKAAR